MKSLKQKLTNTMLVIGIMGISLLSSCDKGFEELNKDPTAYTEPNLENMLSYSIIVAAGGPGYTNNPLYYNCKLAGDYMQYFDSLNPYQWTGDKYMRKPNYV